jgi:hypothetical protein
MAARSVPLFATGQDDRVETITLGQRGTPFLRRSPAMEAMVGHAAAQLLTAPPQEAEGLLYLMLRLDHQGRVVPLYVGRAGRHGRGVSFRSWRLSWIAISPRAHNLVRFR